MSINIVRRGPLFLSNMNEGKSKKNGIFLLVKELQLQIGLAQVSVAVWNYGCIGSVS